jgi:hypothetical protein
MDDSEVNPTDRLQRLLNEAGYTSTATGDGQFYVLFSGRHREWNFRAHATHDWVFLRTYVCDVPSENGLRDKLTSYVLKTNASVSLVKFGIVNGKLTLDIDYRFEHVDASTLGNLIGFLHTIAEEHYAPVFRIVSGDETLTALAGAVAA